MLEMLKKYLIEAMKAHDEPAKDIIRVTLAEAQRLDVVSDEKIINIMRKIVSNNEETIGFTTNEVDKERLVAQNKVLLHFLPKIFSKQELLKLIAPFKDRILTCENQGIAMKLVVSELKSNNVLFNGKDVSEIVQEIKKCSVV